MKAFYLSIFITLFAVAAVSQTKIPNSIRLSSVGSPWEIVMEGDGLDIYDIKTKADGAYFLLYPDKNGLNVSFFIEPVDKCKTSEACRDFILASGNPKWGKFEDLNKGTFKEFSYFEFYRPKIDEQPLQIQDMYAQYVNDGYWTDIHISKPNFKKDEKQLFEKFLSSLKFVPKKDSSDKLTQNLVTTTKKWMQLWDDKKCKESYADLTGISRENVTQQLWVDYCSAIQKNGWMVGSREVIAIATTASLPGYSDRAGASLRFQSIINENPVLEFVSLTLEKDGTWTVSNYRVF